MPARRRKNKRIESGRRPRSRHERQPNIKVPPTISYSDTSRLIRSDTKPSQSRGNKTEQIETISSEYAVKSGIIWPKFIVLGLVLLAVLIGLTNSDQANIDIIQPSGFSYLPQDVSQYKSVATNAIDASLFNRFKPTLSSSDIAAYMEQRFPDIAYVAVTVPLIGYTPTVHIQLSKPVLIFAVDNGNSYLVNPKGYIVAMANSVKPSELKNIPQVNSVIDVPQTYIKQVLTPSSVNFIEVIKQALGLKGILISKMNLVPQAEELDVYPINVPYYIKFNLNQTDALTQVGTFLATINMLKKQNITPSQYVDVRLDGRAYYK